MRLEKQFLTREYVARLNASPFFLLVEYRGMNVGHFTELRKRLAKVGAEMHVVKNSVIRAAVKEVGLADLTGTLNGQLAVVTGKQDIAPTAKVLKVFQGEFERPKLQFGYLGDQRLSLEDLLALADLPPLHDLRGKLLGLFQAPASQLVRLLNTPASQLARVLQARNEKLAGTPAQ
ncbi:MAG: 50S ribosomal protein L10 [Verrucomicrobia bacterium]|jgi:large subunit ribosomal protein L10|nr:50S ribosomal protein L10 [Verrucomicrobiota bacterium]OQC63443.1 MAG: 50S ribosomal protein L10 [Verrucomicrobia bacterium ADurb.Bin006]MDI9381281.1 50S ribosomal protein L10 [Verrucomicrobiota bacterium]NMD22038.1 50S ribosomal protein L10 [Verrucomicrobiota bacterium]HOA60222.1 50S ribosomal protein L10 [Verrucomicrobiota bacterium]